MKSEGLGDTIEKITTKTGIKKVVKWLVGEDCGCDQRKEKLNKMFPYIKPNCLTEQEYEFLKNFNFNISVIETSYGHQLLKIYNRVFNKKQKYTQCSSCWRNILEDLKKIYEEYK